ncbi:MAG: hypothetical protein ACKOEW_09705 [Methylocystis sp.]
MVTSLEPELKRKLFFPYSFAHHLEAKKFKKILLATKRDIIEDKALKNDREQGG